MLGQTNIEVRVINADTLLAQLSANHPPDTADAVLLYAVLEHRHPLERRRRSTGDRLRSRIATPPPTLTAALPPRAFFPPGAVRQPAPRVPPAGPVLSVAVEGVRVLDHG